MGKHDGALTPGAFIKETNFFYNKTLMLLACGQKAKSVRISWNTAEVGIWRNLLTYTACLHFLCQSTGLVVSAFE